MNEFDFLIQLLTSSSLNQDRLSAVSMNQYSLAPPLIRLMLLMVNQPLRITWGARVRGEGSGVKNTDRGWDSLVLFSGNFRLYNRVLCSVSFIQFNNIMNSCCLVISMNYPSQDCRIYWFHLKKSNLFFFYKETENHHNKFLHHTYGQWIQYSDNIK